jgi:4-hydroxy-3-polyprenylbenzoate decarboxylase
MHSIWGTGQAMFSKCIVVVDESVDEQNYSEVAWKALNNSTRHHHFCCC